MKTISSRFLKGALAILLVVVMLFGSTISGFAAVVDNADTKANVDLAEQMANKTYVSGEYVYFKNYKPSGWGSPWIQSSGYYWIHLYNSSNSDYCDAKFTLYSGTANAEGAIYRAKITTAGTYNKMIFTRTSGSSTPWDGEWNRSGEITLDGNYNYFYGWSVGGTDETQSRYAVPPKTSTMSFSGDTLGGTGTESDPYLVEVGTSYTVTVTATKEDPGMDGYGLSINTSSSKEYSGTSSSYSETITADTVDEQVGYAGYAWCYKYSASYYSSSLKSSNTIHVKTVQSGYDYTVTAGEGGTITSATSGTATSTTITAKADTGYTFDKWTVTGNGSVANDSNASTTLTINANGVNAHATFKKLTYTVTFEDADGTVLDTQTVEYGSSATAPALPTKEGYTSSWDKSYANITGNTTVKVVYTANPQSVAVSADPTAGGTVTINGSTTTPQTVDYDSSVTVSATANEGYKFLGWYENGSTKVSDDASYTFTCKGDISLVAKFGPKVYTITTEVSPAGAGTATVNGQSSVTVDYNTSVNLVATVNDGYEFVGWYLGDTQKSTSTTYSVPATDDVTYTAKFNKIWDVTVKVPTGVETVSFVGDNINADKTYEDITDGTVVRNFQATTAVDYKLVGWEVTKNGETETFNETSIDVTVDADTTITPVVEKLYYAIVAGNTATANDYYEVGETVTLTFDVETGKYLTGVTVAPAMELDVDINKDAGSVTFTMPENNVTFTPQYGDMYMVNFSADIFTSTTNKGYYYPGQAVTIEVTPKGGHVITTVTSDQTDVTYANKVITFTMPAENVTLDVEYSASFKAYSDVITVHIHNPNHTAYDSTEQGGTVTMTCNGATLAEGGFADGDVTYTATVKNSNYQFVGFYSDYDCNKFLTAETTYTVSPESDVTVYALFARKQRITVSGTKSEMIFDPKTKAYTMTFIESGTASAGTAVLDSSLFNSGFTFAVSYDDSTTHDYYGFGSTMTVNMNNNSYGRSVSWGTDIWQVDGAHTNTTYPLTIIIKPESVHSYTNIDVSARAVKNGATIYLSSGWKDMPNELNPTSAFTSTVTGATTTNLSHNINNVYYNTESYVEATISSAQQVTFKTTLSGSDADNYYVDSFVVYDIYDDTYTIVEPNSSGSNVYEGTVYVDNDCYIVPIFFHTEEYIASQTGYKTIELYFDATSIQGTSWGPFVSAYAYGDDWYTGVWTGQMMIPTEDGSSWYTQVTVPETGLSGIVFNNYLYDTCPSTNAGAFGVSGSNLQTYDYREALTLYELEYDVITFVAKTSKDGYHGDDLNHSAGVTTDYYVSNTTNALDGRYVFDYLYSRDGVTPMDLNAEKIENVTKSYDANGSVNNAEYYIISSGDHHYDATHYSEDSNYNGEWSVEWYVFDNEGNYITNVLSDGFYNDKDKDGDTYLIEQLKSKGYTNIDQAVVAISYEAPNQGAGDTQISYDGQWYGNMLDDTVNGQVIVGLDDGNGNFTIDEVDPTNDADYGSGYLKDLEGNLHQTLDIEIDYGVADLTASAKTGYRFIGWYTKKADGTYVEISKNTAYSTYINMDTTYYAIFRELGEKEVVINHRKYVNPNDAAIMSHDGVGEMSIEVRDSDGNVVATGPINTASTSAAFNADEGKTYTIRITTTPLMNGKFFAWYTDSFKADGTKTYEEVLTEEEHRDSPSTVYAEFDYTYDSTDPTLQTNITIYSDIRRVSNKATIIYSYLNRFNTPCTYTIKDVPLSDEECLGFAGNNNKPYVPAYYTLLEFEDGTTKYVEPGTEGQYNFVSSSNKLQSYAPDANVTEAFNDQIRWMIESSYITAEESIVRVKADQDAPDYTVTYTMPDENGENVTKSESGEYNTLMKITAPPTDKEGDAFSYWYEPATDEILCYTPYYNYMIVENKTIVAVYGAEVTQKWSPSINSVTYTREFSDDNDFVYTDYLLAFNNIDSKILTEVYKDENIEYGLLVYRDANYYIEGKDSVTYPKDPSEIANDTNNVEYYLKEIAKTRKKNMAFPVGDTKYNCYYYNLTGNDLTIFNRCDYFVRYYNDYVVYTDADGKDYYYRDYALTAVAYIIVDGEVYLSNPKNVNFYELGNMPVTGSGNN